MVTDDRMTSRIVRWRSVRVVSRGPLTASPVLVEVSLLSPMQANVVAAPPIIKHVFDACRAGGCGAGVTEVTEVFCRWVVLWFGYESITCSDAGFFSNT